MEDRLADLLKYFELEARTFQAGPLRHAGNYDGRDGLGYIHVQLNGCMRLESACHPAVEVDEPSLYFYMNPTHHRVVPLDDRVTMVCASLRFASGGENPIARALPDLVLIRLADTPTLEPVIKVLVQEAREQHCGRQAVLNRLMEIVVIGVLRELMDQNILQTGMLAGLAHPKLHKAINAMHAEPGRNWNLESLASIAGMSRARFSSKFHEVVGTPPGLFLTQWRLNVAQALLRRGEPLQLVADATGYSSTSALTRAFVTQLGLPPKQWLKQELEAAKPEPARTKA